MKWWIPCVKCFLPSCRKAAAAREKEFHPVEKPPRLARDNFTPEKSSRGSREEISPLKKAPAARERKFHPVKNAPRLARSIFTSENSRRGSREDFAELERLFKKKSLSLQPIYRFVSILHLVLSIHSPDVATSIYAETISD